MVRKRENEIKGMSIKKVIVKFQTRAGNPSHSMDHLKHAWAKKHGTGTNGFQNKLFEQKTLAFKVSRLTLGDKKYR